MNAVIVLQSVFSLFVLWLFVFYLWRDYRLDSFREDIFSVRDRMFLYASNRNIRFDDPAYTILRNRMNTILRYGHVFTLTRLILVAKTHGEFKNDTLVQWEAAVAQLPEETQRKMREFNLCMVIFVLQHVIYCSFFRYVLVRPLLFLRNPFDLEGMMDRPEVVSTVELLESDALEQDARRIARNQVTRRPVVVA